MRYSSASRSILLLTLLAVSISGCSKSEKAAASGPPPTVPVTVATVEKKDVPITIRAIGNVEPIQKVDVKSQIAGQVMDVHFKEGDEVKKGDILFQIDPRQGEADLNKALGQLARDKAAAENAKADAARYDQLFKQGVTSRQEFDRVSSAADQAQAAVAADQAAVDNARLQLKYTKIEAPVSGKTGNLAVTVGNIVKSNEAVLVTINQISPIYVTFSVPEQQLPEVKKYMNSGLKVEALPPGASVGTGVEGKVTFVDNAVDVQTGTLKLKATFANTKETLWPGAFVDVVLTLTEQPNAIVVPSAGVNVSQNGQYVFLVKPDKSVAMQPITVQRTFGDRSIVSEGLKPGDVVVTDGQLRLSEGSKIEIKGQYQQPKPIPGISGADLATTPTIPNTSLPAPAQNSGAAR